MGRDGISIWDVAGTCGGKELRMCKHTFGLIIWEDYVEREKSDFVRFLSFVLGCNFD